MRTVTYHIPIERVGEFVKRFERIEKKAAKLGGLVGYKLGPVTQQRIAVDDHETKQSYTALFEVQEVTVWGESPVIEGWEVIAVIDHTPALVGSPFNIVHDLGGVSSGDKYRTTENSCDHCGWDRRRKKTVILRHLTSREQKQVGLGCLADFIGSHDPHRAARLCEYVADALTPYDGGWNNAEPLLDKQRFLATVAAAIRTDGWVSRSQSGRGKDATVDVALEAYSAKRKHRISAANEDYERATKALEWVEFEADTSNDFLAKLHAALAGEGLVRKHAGIAAALFVAYDKARERSNREAAAQAAKSASGHVGVVGERDEFDVTVTGKREYAKRQYSYYDTAAGSLVSFVDASGNVLKWFTTAGGKVERKLQEGRRYRIAATVKAHGDYREVAETTISRVNIVQELS